MQTLAIDLGKQSFHIYGITSDGEVISRKVSRANVNRRANGTPYRRAKGTPFSRWLKVDRTRAFALRAA